MHFVLLGALFWGADSPAADALQRRTWDIDGVEREALVYMPPTADTKPAPLVFGFHGHGGTVRIAARKYRLHELWPEAIVVYMQGLPTPGQLTDPEGKRPGWQKTGDDQGGRDLKFFDAVLTSLRKECQVDETRIYSMGHSNGAGFTFVLWEARPELFAALAPSAAPGLRQLASLKKPCPIIQFAGRKDPLVKLAWMQPSMNAVRKLNGCAEVGEDWGGGATIYPSKSGTPQVAYIHDGGHEFVDVAPELIVRFFKQHARPSKNER